MHACSVTQSCLTLCKPMDSSLPSSSVHGILQARRLKQVSISSSRTSSWPRIGSMSLASPALAGGYFAWPGKPLVIQNQVYLPAIIYRGLILCMEKEMASHSTVLAWRIPGTGEPGELPSMGSHRVRHDWSDLAAAAAAAAVLCRVSWVTQLLLYFSQPPLRILT